MVQPYVSGCPSSVDGSVVVEVSSCTGTEKKTFALEAGIFWDFFWVTFWAGDDGATLVGSLFDLAVLADGFGEGTDPQVAHEHPVVAGAVEAGLVRDYPVAFIVVLEIVVASRRVSDCKEIAHMKGLSRRGVAGSSYRGNSPVRCSAR